MSVAVAIIVRLLGLFGINLSGFAAGAIVAALLAAAFAGYSGFLVHQGYAWAEGKCEAAALQAQIETLKADRDAARRALADERLRLASIEKQAADDKEGTAAYVEDLKKTFSSACALDDADLRGMRQRTGPGGARARAAGAARFFTPHRAGPADRQGR